MAVNLLLKSCPLMTPPSYIRPSSFATACNISKTLCQPTPPMPSASPLASWWLSRPSPSSTVSAPCACVRSVSLFSSLSETATTLAASMSIKKSPKASTCLCSIAMWHTFNPSLMNFRSSCLPSSTVFRLMASFFLMRQLCSRSSTSSTMSSSRLHRMRKQAKPSTFGRKTKPSAGFTNTTIPSKSVVPCAKPPTSRAIAVKWPFATSSLRPNTSSVS